MEWLMQLGDGWMLGVEKGKVQRVQTGYPYPDVPGGQEDRMCGVLGVDSVQMGYLMGVVNALPLPMDFAEFALRVKTGGSGSVADDLHMALADFATGGVACVDKDLLSRRLMNDISGLTEYLGDGCFKLTLPYLGVAYGKDVRGFRQEFEGYLKPARVKSAAGDEVVLTLEGLVQPELYGLVYSALVKAGKYKGKRTRFTRLLGEYFSDGIPPWLLETAGNWSSGHCNVVAPLVDIISYYTGWKDQVQDADEVMVDVGMVGLGEFWDKYSPLEFVHDNREDVLFMFWYYLYSKYKVFAQGISVEVDGSVLLFKSSGRLGSV